MTPLEIAKEVLAGTTRSHVGAARLLAEHVVAEAERARAGYCRTCGRDVANGDAHKKECSDSLGPFGDALLELTLKRERRAKAHEVDNAVEALLGEAASASVRVAGVGALREHGGQEASAVPSSALTEFYDIRLKGWNCRRCGVFCGEEKETLTTCRSCDAPRPT